MYGMVSEPEPFDTYSKIKSLVDGNPKLQENLKLFKEQIVSDEPFLIDGKIVRFLGETGECILVDPQEE